MEQGDAKNKKYLICRLGKQIMMAIKTSRLVHFINTTQTENLYYTLTGERIFSIHDPLACKAILNYRIHERLSWINCHNPSPSPKPKVQRTWSDSLFCCCWWTG